MFQCKFKEHRLITDMRLLSKHVALVCILLMFSSAFAFAAHHHSNATESAKCTTCVAAHSASPKTISVQRQAVFVQVATFTAEPISARQRLIVFQLSVRPPPVV